jgi:hypothetical protein
MQHKFKRHDKVRLLIDPDPEFVEYDTEVESRGEHPQIKNGMVGEVNVVLQNGQYHVRVLDEGGKAVAFVPMDEEFLEKID